MRGHNFDHISQYEAGEYRRAGRHSSKVAQNYREKFLALRKTMREFSRANGVEFSDDINKMIGMK